MKKRNDQKTILITGASSGIGYGLVREAIKEGYFVFASVRREEDAKLLNKEFGESCEPLFFDVTDDKAIKEGVIKVKRLLGDKNLGALINNAGYASGGPIALQPLKDIRHQFEVNLFGQIAVIQAFLPLLRSTSKYEAGRIINISSVGGKISFPIMGAYSATKHAFEAISEALRRELHLFGIKVIIVGPGSVATKIWGKANNIDLRPYRGTAYEEPIERILEYTNATGPKGLSIEKSGKRLMKIIKAKRPRVRYVLVKNYWTNWLLPRILSPKTLDRIIAKQFHLSNNDS